MLDDLGAGRTPYPMAAGLAYSLRQTFRERLAEMDREDAAEDTAKNLS